MSGWRDYTIYPLNPKYQLFNITISTSGHRIGYIKYVLVYSVLCPLFCKGSKNFNNTKLNKLIQILLRKYKVFF